MTQLTDLDKMLGIQPVYSFGDFRSGKAKALGMGFGIQFGTLPDLIKQSRAFNEAWAKGMPRPVLDGPGIFAAQSLLMYEHAERARAEPQNPFRGFRLIVPEKDDIASQVHSLVGDNPSVSVPLLLDTVAAKYESDARAYPNINYSRRPSIFAGYFTDTLSASVAQLSQKA